MKILNDTYIDDSRAREEALDTTRSFIVQAPAGSGKTEILMQRYLKLLAAVRRPEEILAITFTRKAAGEMHKRIIEALEGALEGGSSVGYPENLHEKRRIELAKAVLQRDTMLKWNILENPGRLKIQTIDSFCAYITKGMPILSTFGRQPSVTELPEELYREAARRTIGSVEQENRTGNAVRVILKHLDNSVSALEDRLVAMLGNRDQWLRHIKGDIDEQGLRNLLDHSLRKTVEETLEDAKKGFNPRMLERIVACARYAAENMGPERRVNSLFLPENLNRVPGITVEELPLWKGIAELLLTKGNDFRKPGGINSSIGFPSDTGRESVAMKSRFREIISELTGDERAKGALIKIRNLPDSGYRRDEWKILTALLLLLPDTVRRLRELFMAEGLVDFQEIAMAAIDALGTEDNPTDLMLSLDMKLQHILIDEYQDTSRLQFDLVRALTRGWEEGDGRTIFIVGDPMQSIYLFREAEVGLFLNAKKNGIGVNTRLELLTLKSNFRSQANIVEWVNSNFKSAFPAVENTFMGAIRYIPFFATRPPLNSPGVDVVIFEEKDDIREAMEIAGIVKGIDRRESVAILARARSHLKDIIKILRREGIDYNSREIAPLIERPVILDLLSLLRALLHPYDRAAWLSILRAPWCGLTLRDMHRLCIGGGDTPLWLLINEKERISSLSEDGIRRIGRFLPVMRKWLSFRGRIDIRKVVEGAWIELGGPACASDNYSIDDADIFLDILSSVKNSGEFGAFERLMKRIKEVYTMNTGAPDCNLQIMTIHKAKGLEFDHVIIPGLGKRVKRMERKLLFWLEKGDGLLMAPIEARESKKESLIYRYIKGIIEEKERLEETRLLYVAVTRAKRHLHIFGHVSKRGSDSLRVDSDSLLGRIYDGLDREQIYHNKKEYGEKDVAVTPGLKRLPATYMITAPQKMVKTASDKSDIASAGTGERYRREDEVKRHLGIIVHRYLFRIAREGISRWDKKYAMAQAGSMAKMLNQLGLNKNESAVWAARAVEIILKTLEDKRGRWILEKHDEAKEEWPVTGFIEGRIVHGVIDRTFVAEGVRWIIDYKTESFEGEGFAGRERERYERQLNLYVDILKAKGEKRQIRRGLYYPAFGGWIYW